MSKHFVVLGGLSAAAAVVAATRLWGLSYRAVSAADAPPNSFAPVVMTETFNQVKAKMEADKPAVMKRQLDPARRAVRPVRPSVGDGEDGPHQAAAGRHPRQLTAGTTGTSLPAWRPRNSREEGPVSRRLHAAPPIRIMPEGECSLQIRPSMEAIKPRKAAISIASTWMFDLPETLPPEFPPAIYLTTRPDLGDVSQGKLVTIENFYELFNGILNPEAAGRLRLLLTPFAQQ